MGCSGWDMAASPLGTLPPPLAQCHTDQPKLPHFAATLGKPVLYCPQKNVVEGSWPRHLHPNNPSSVLSVLTGGFAGYNAWGKTQFHQPCHVWEWPGPQAEAAPCAVPSPHGGAQLPPSCTASHHNPAQLLHPAFCGRNCFLWSADLWSSNTTKDHELMLLLSHREPRFQIFCLVCCWDLWQQHFCDWLNSNWMWRAGLMGRWLLSQL